MSTGALGGGGGGGQRGREEQINGRLCIIWGYPSYPEW
jgi:hypothetical protein